MSASERPTTAAGRILLDALAAQDRANGESIAVDWGHGILAIEAEAARHDTLNVERLAQAARQMFGGKPPGWEVLPTAPYQQRADSAFRHLANDLAAEYARLSEPTE